MIIIFTNIVTRRLGYNFFGSRWLMKRLLRHPPAEDSFKMTVVGGAEKLNPPSSPFTKGKDGIWVIM
jgi:hypothetical protein